MWEKVTPVITDEIESTQIEQLKALLESSGEVLYLNFQKKTISRTLFQTQFKLFVELGNRYLYHRSFITTMLLMNIQIQIFTRLNRSVSAPNHFHLKSPAIFSINVSFIRARERRQTALQYEKKSILIKISANEKSIKKNFEKTIERNLHRNVRILENYLNQNVQFPHPVNRKGAF